MADSTLEERRLRELAFWADRYRRQWPRRIVPAEIEANELRPCFEGRGDHKSENRMFFHAILDGAWKGRCVLDYACGMGDWAVYFALTGARRVVGFDVNPVGVELGGSLAREHGVADRVRLVRADAVHPPFRSGAFDLVIGTSVLHHVVKYGDVFDALHRVMKPGGRAFFLENLADFPAWRLRWWLKGAVPDGDVPIFSREVRRRARLFSKVEIIGDTLVHSLKRIIYRRDGDGKLPAWRSRLLRWTWKTDQALFRTIPALRAWGSWSVIILTK